MLARVPVCTAILFSAGMAFAEEPADRVALANGDAPQVTAKGKYIPSSEVEAFIREGNRLMREGDILGARQSYQKAFASGDAAAALVMGRSYDPIYFARIAEKNAGPDAAKALEWYRRAMDTGAVQTAMVRINALNEFMHK